MAAGESSESIRAGAQVEAHIANGSLSFFSFSSLLWALAFWLRPLGVFRVFNQAQMYLIGARGSFIDVGEYRIHYYTLGPADGPVVVLVHGLGGRSEDWEKLAPYLAKAGYRVYLPDLPGFGESDKPADFSYSVKRRSDDSRRIFRRARIEASRSGRLVDGRLDRTARRG